MGDRKKTATGFHVPVSFRQEHMGIIENIDDLVKSGRVNLSRSALILSACDMVYGKSNINLIEDHILARYSIRSDRVFKDFNAVLNFELKQKSIGEIIELWQITNWDMAYILYRHCIGIGER